MLASISKVSFILILKYLGFVYKLFLVQINKIFEAYIYFCDLFNYFFQYILVLKKYKFIY